MMQNPVAANHTIAVPTKPVNRSHQGLWVSDSTDLDLDHLIDTTFDRLRRGL